MLNHIKNKVWIYWAITDILLIMAVTEWPKAYTVAIGLTLFQIGHFYRDTPQLMSFPVQVRVAYLLLLIVALWSPLSWVVYPVILGTTAMVLFDYCFLARFMSLMPWNHQQPFSFNLIFKTFFSKPVAGSVKISY